MANLKVSWKLLILFIAFTITKENFQDFDIIKFMISLIFSVLVLNVWIGELLKVENDK